MIVEILKYWPFALTAVMLAAAARSDYRRRVVPDKLTMSALAVALLGHLACSMFVKNTGGNVFSSVGVMGIRDSIYGLLLASVPMAFVWRVGGVGGGDVKLLAAVGTALGWRWTLDVMFASFVLAAAWAVLIIIRKNIAGRTFANIWKFLARSRSREDKKQATADSPGIQFAVAVAGGFIAAIASNVIAGMNVNFTMKF